MKKKKIMSCILAVAIAMTSVNIGVWQAQSYEQKSEPFRYMKDDTRTAQYIVKYKQGEVDQFTKKIDHYIKNKRGFSTNKLYEKIALNDSLMPEAFAQILQEKKTTQEIEWIMPDHLLTLSNIQNEEQQAESQNAETETAGSEEEDLISSADSVPEEKSENDEQSLSESQDQSCSASDENAGDSRVEEQQEETLSNTDTEESLDEETLLKPQEEEQLPEEEPMSDPREIIVAVIDGGVEITHPWFVGKLWVNTQESADGQDEDGNGYKDDIYGCNVIEQNGELYDVDHKQENIHGTHVAGLIAKLAAENNVPVKIMPIRAFQQGQAYTSDIIKAIEYATVHGATVINLSFGSTEENPALQEAMAASNAVFICAAGNSRQNLDEIPVYPAAYMSDQIISVASVNGDDGFSYFSNYGRATVSVAARGRDVESAAPDGLVGTMTGTSVAAATVSGILAVAFAKDTTLTTTNVKQRLLSTSDRLDHLQNKVIGGRRVNIANLLSNTIVTSISEVNSEDDFDVSSYVPLQESEAFETFTKKKVIDAKLGQGHCIALLEDGTVWAWGRNDYGQLGNNTLINSYYPVQVIGLKNIVKIAAGSYHTIAVTSQGNIYTWGRNTNGQLSTFDTENRLIPSNTATISGDWNIKQIVAGEDFSAVLIQNDNGFNQVMICGSNEKGQLSQPTVNGNSVYFGYASNTPSEIAEIAAGKQHVLLRSGATVYGWGYNEYGQLGNQENGDVTACTQLHTNVTQIGCGDYHSFIVQNGNGMGFGSNTASAFSELNPVGAIEPGYSYNYPVYSFASTADNPVNTATGGSGGSAILFQNGDLLVRGSNYSGQLGIETTGEYLGYYTKLMGDVAKVDAVGSNIVFVCKDGTVWVTGDSFYGQRGDRAPYKTIPTKMKNLSGALDIQTGERNAVALTQGGLVKTWGSNSNNLLGIEGLSSCLTPREMPVACDIQSINASGIAIGDHAYYNENNTRAATAIYRWGGTQATPVKTEQSTLAIKGFVAEHEIFLNQDGSVSVSPNYCSHAYCNRLTSISEIGPITDIAMGNTSQGSHIIALKGDGTVWSWGVDAPGTTGSSQIPHQIAALNQIVQITSKNQTAYALKNDGTIWSWSYSVSNGKKTYTTPVQKYSGMTVQKIAQGESHLLMLTEEGKVYAVGLNTYGQLGDGTLSTKTQPVLVSGLQEVLDIFAGDAQSYALLKDGTCCAWGSNSDGLLGIGEGIPKYEATKIGALNQPIDDPNAPANLGTISAGSLREGSFYVADEQDYYRFRVSQSGVYAFNVDHAVGLELQTLEGTTIASIKKTMPAQLIEKLESSTDYLLKVTALSKGDYTISVSMLKNATGITALAGGSDHSVALDQNGIIWTWGSNAFGQLGSGTTTDNYVPYMLKNFKGNIAIAAGDGFSLALKEDGTVWAWGKNDVGQLGGAAQENVSLPVQITTLQNIIAIAAGDAYGLALRNDGTVWAWGKGSDGQLGNGETSDQTVPAQVQEITNIQTIAAGKKHALACTEDGTVYAWGDNVSGQLGDNTTTDRLKPVQVQDVQNVKKISAGGAHSIAITRDQSVWLWGDQTENQLGTLQGNTKKPQKLTSISNALDIAAGNIHTVIKHANPTSNTKTMGNNTKEQLGRNNSDTIANVLNIGETILWVEAGAYHNLAINCDGAIYTWGDNTSGQLGNSSTTNSIQPVDITTGFLHNTFARAAEIEVEQIASAILGPQDTAYYMEFCVETAAEYNITVDRGVAKLYDDAQQQIGQAFDTNASYALDVGIYYLRLSDMLGNSHIQISCKQSTEMNWRSIAVGDRFSLAVDAQGLAWGFGKNDYGQIGDATTIDKNIPIPIGMGTEWKMAAAGNNFGLLLSRNGEVYSFGDDSSYQLGMRIGNSPEPMALVSLQNVRAIAAGGESGYALKRDGTVWAWGDNTYGQLGNGSNLPSRQAVQVQGLSGIIQIAAGESYAMALGANGKVYTWGKNTEGQLGRGNTTNSNIPVSVSLNLHVMSIAAGSKHAIAITDTGSAYAWGKGESYQLGNNDSSNKTTPVQIMGITTAKTAAASETSSFLVLQNGRIAACGTNVCGSLGLGMCEWEIMETPDVIDNLENITQVYAGKWHVFAVSADGKIYTWGDNEEGALGNAGADAQKGPAKIPNLTNVKDVAVGACHSLALKENGTVWGWGNSTHGQIGSSGTYDTYIPVQIVGLSNVSKIATGQVHSLALKTDGTVWSWGGNNFGQLGNGETTSSSTPIQVLGLSDIVEVAAGGYFSLARKSDGTVYAWGDNISGQLGIGTTTSQSTPQQVAGLTNITKITAGFDFALAYDVVGEKIYAWGENANGQLGDGTTQDKTSPTSVFSTGTCETISAGTSHSIFITSNDHTFGAGSNAQGQLGLANAQYNTFDLVGFAKNIYAGGNKSILCNADISDKIRYLGAFTKVSLPEITKFALGDTHHLAIDTNKNVWSWGSNFYYQLGRFWENFEHIPCDITDMFISNYSFDRAIDVGTKFHYIGALNQKQKAHYIKLNIDMPGSYTLRIEGEEIASNLHYPNQQLADMGYIKVADDLQTYTISSTGTYYLELVGTQVGTYDIWIIPNNANDGQILVDLHANSSYDFAFRANAVTDFTNLTYTLNYPKGDFELISACTEAGDIVKSGIVEGTDVNITLIQDGKIQFEITKIPENAVSGVVNTIKLRALRNGKSKVELSVQ